MSWSICQPVPVLLPEESGLRREFLRRKVDEGGTRLVPGDEQYAQYDTRTLFYDVFRREANPRRVIAIGPPPANLEPELRGLRIFRAGRALRHRLLRYPRLTVAEIMLDRSAASERESELDFAFPSFAARVRVPPGADAIATPRPRDDGKGPLAMMTLQKDNEIIWIEDWCRWHRRLHDVTRFFIYDNASANIGLLEEALRGLSDEMDIALVRWPYPFGPHPAHGNQFAQIGAMNHYRLRFGPDDPWCLLMDVDEYLAASGARALRDVLAASERRGVVSLRMDSFMVPPHPGQAPARARRVWHHAWRGRCLRGFSEKCIFVPSRCTYNMDHYACPGNRLFACCERWPGSYRLAYFWYRRVPHWIERLERRGARWRRAGARWLRCILPGTHRMQLRPVDDLFFFHFHALNTDWKPGRRSERVESFNPERHVQDPRMRALAEQAGLVPDGAPPPGAGAPKEEDAGAPKEKTLVSGGGGPLS